MRPSLSHTQSVCASSLSPLSLSVCLPFVSHGRLCPSEPILSNMIILCLAFGYRGSTSLGLAIGRKSERGREVEKKEKGTCSIPMLVACVAGRYKLVEGLDLCQLCAENTYA